MSDERQSSKVAPKGAGKAAERTAKVDRLAAALRENLKRRKAQARSRAVAAGADKAAEEPR